MFEAIVRKKTNFLSARYVNGHHKFEDPIISIVFGPLHYIPAHEALAFFSKVFEDQQAQFDAISSSIMFWKKMYKNTEAYVEPQRWAALYERGIVKNHVEPDLLIEFPNSQDEVRRRYLIEAKWDSPEGDHELEKQWGILTDEIQSSTVHVFLAKSIPKKLSREEVKTCTWHRFAVELKAFFLPSLSPQFRQWQSRTVEFLNAVDSQIHTFSGFSELSYTASSQWTPRYFDTSVITKYVNQQYQEKDMPATSANSIVKATELLKHVWEELFALRREIGYQFQTATDEYFKKYEEGIQEDFTYDNTTETVIREYFWQYNVFLKRKKYPDMYVAFLITLDRQPETFPNLEEATIHVMLSSEDQLDEEYPTSDAFGWQYVEDEDQNVILECAAKLQNWLDSNIRIYAVPLTAINSRKDIKENIIDPVVALIREEQDENLKIVENTFNAASYLMQFKPFEKGVCKADG